MKRGKKGQMKLSFGMIFSIILIIVFIAFAFYAIMKFLDWQKTIQIGKFYNELQTDVDKMWRSSHGREAEEYVVPGAVEKICFVNSEEPQKGLLDSEIYNELTLFAGKNLVLYPVSWGELSSISIKHINLVKTLKTNNPLCIENIDGKVKITIKMDLGDSLVTIQK